jgi:raffinose/stachyose/melibiose transport system permease protein
MEKAKKSKIMSIVLWCIAGVAVVFWSVVAIVPFIFMVLNSFKEQFEVMTEGVFSLPKAFYLDNYKTVLEGDFVRYFVNSVVVLLISLVVLLFISACAAYPLSRFKFKLGKPIYSIIVACMSIPIHITLIPVFRMTKDLGIYDSIWALIGPYVAMAVPISVFILTSFMKEIPVEIEESGQIDGCGYFRSFFSIILPLSKPGLATLAIYNGVNMWNEFIFAYTLTQSQEARTLPLAVWDFQGQYNLNVPMIMSVLTMTVLPMIILYIFAQDNLVKGMTAGAVKG